MEVEWCMYMHLAISGADNGSSPVWCQAIIWTNVGLLLLKPLGLNFCESEIKI